jgi:glycosyltransferase involved in cell wall biosynthesis
MSNKYKISVITPSYNSGRYLEEAIQSVIKQNYPSFEHIVVDGGSTDETLDILKNYSHLTWVSEPDNGQSDAMNKGFRISTGDIIVYLNVDDYFLPGAFDRVVPFFENGSKFVVGNVLIINDNGKSYLNEPRVMHDEMLRHWEKNAFCVNPVGYFYLKEVQENVPPFNPKNHFAMDLEFLLECSLKYTFTKIDSHEPLGAFRHHRHTKTSIRNENLSELYTFENFSFIDKFLQNRDPKFIEEYNQLRMIGYQKRIKYREGQNAKVKKKSLLKKSKTLRKIRDFLRSDQKMDIIRQFVKSHIR